MPAPLEIRFGTDGWRGVIARDFTFDTVRLVARAVAATFRAIHPGDQPPLLAVGHDTRFLSRRFAQVAAEALAAEGLNVCMTTSYLPTPVLAWSVPMLGAQGGLMVTASHNPPSYNGLKVRTDDGGPATPTITQQIEAEARRLSSDPTADREDDSLQKGLVAGAAIEPFDPIPRYRARLGALVNTERIARSRLTVVIDAMYGASQGLVTSLLREVGLEADEVHGEVNPWFGGRQPEPLPEHLHELAERVKSMGNSRRIGLAFDGDGDRLAAIAEDGSYVTPHQIFALLLRHLVTRRGLSGTVVKTFSTTTMIDRLAAAYGLRVIVTPIGFKYVAEVMRREEVLIGGEESGGIGIAGHIPERDGIVSALLLLEALATEEKSLGAVLRELQTEVGPHYYRRLDLGLDCVVDVRELERRILAEPPTSIEGWHVKEVQTLDGVKLVGEDGGWLLIRPSGTEPVLRLYAEAPTIEQVSRLLAWGKACTDGLRKEC
ncbi:MAG TPA: phosphoglucomutase/phosphomannomutase family protein [Candidatus Methylomirabilis sp.]|nr:phosphoglucomutase/phosphomannomutase family protein [Candidatus Methylomirabilis sp.]